MPKNVPATSKGMPTVALPSTTGGGNDQPVMPLSTKTPSTPDGGNVSNQFLQGSASHQRMLQDWATLLRQATTVSSEANSRIATKDPIVVVAGLENTSPSAPDSQKKKSKTSKSTATPGASSSRKRDHDSMSNASAHTGDAAAHIAAQASGGASLQSTKYQRILPANLPANMPANMRAHMPTNMPPNPPPNPPPNLAANGQGSNPANIQLGQNHSPLPDIMELQKLEAAGMASNSWINSFISTSHLNEQARQAQSQGLCKLLSSQIDAHTSHIEACDQAFQDLQAAHRRADAAREWETTTIHSMIAKRLKTLEELEEENQELRKDIWEKQKLLSQMQGKRCQQEG